VLYDVSTLYFETDQSATLIEGRVVGGLTAGSIK
jgi:hypothetical protein